MRTIQQDDKKSNRSATIERFNHIQSRQKQQLREFHFAQAQVKISSDLRSLADIPRRLYGIQYGSLRIVYRARVGLHTRETIEKNGVPVAFRQQKQPWKPWCVHNTLGFYGVSERDLQRVVYAVPKNHRTKYAYVLEATRILEVRSLDWERLPSVVKGIIRMRLLHDPQHISTVYVCRAQTPCKSTCECADRYTRIEGISRERAHDIKQMLKTENISSVVLRKRGQWVPVN